VLTFNEKSSNVFETSRDVERLLQQIGSEHEKAMKLEKELEQEKTVLEERLQVGSLFLFSQIIADIDDRVRKECWYRLVKIW
jgi:hypothetical protein